MIKPVFENIKPFILENLSLATKSIWVASAFFTDKDIFRLLCILAKKGIDVKLLISDHPINLINSEINFQELIDSSGSFILANRTNYDSLMHHKFCIIDNTNVITGSYNWTLKAATENIENIVLIKDINVANKFQEEFVKVEERFSNKQVTWQEERIPSGFLAIDKITKGFYPGELILLTGRSNMKHDILAQNIALMITQEFKIRVAYITTNQSSFNLVKSLISIQSKIPLKKINLGRLEDYEWQALQNATDAVNNIPLDIQDGNLTLDEIEKKCKISKYKETNLIIIDNIDCFLRPSVLNNSDEFNQKILSRFKQISRLIRLPIIVIADIPSPKRENTPGSLQQTLYDLGYIYNVCDTIILIHRDEEYGIFEDENGYSRRGLADVIINKHYLGLDGKGSLSFNQDLNIYSDNDILGVNENLSDIIKSSRIDDEDIPF